MLWLDGRDLLDNRANARPAASFATKSTNSPAEAVCGFNGARLYLSRPVRRRWNGVNQRASTDRRLSR